MKKVKAFLINEEALEKLDIVIEKINIKRSFAVEILMQKFNNEISADKNRLRRFVMTQCKFSNTETTKISTNIDEDIVTEFFKNIGNIKKTDALNKLIFEFLQLSEEEKFNTFFGE